MGKTDVSCLVEDIYKLFDKDTQLDDKLFVELGGNIEELIKARLSPSDHKNHLRMSNIGRPDRQLYYDIHSKEEREKFQPQTLIKFLYGDMIEQMIITLAKQAGYDVEDEQKEIELDGIKGHIDFRIGNCVIDVKSASTFSFQKFETGALFEPGNDPFGYVAQLAGYVEAVNPGGRGGFLAVDKTLGKLCFCEIPRHVLERYKVRERIAHIKDVVASPDLPERCYPDKPDGKSGNMKLDTGCSYCSHRFNCWSDANGGAGLKTYYYSNGPRYLTKVVKEPRVNTEFPDDF